MPILKVYDKVTDTWFETPVEDPTLYMRHDGSVAMTGSLNMGGQAITNVGNVDGRNVSADGIVLDAHVADTSDPHGAIMTVSTRLVTPIVRNSGAAGVTLDAFDQTSHRTVYVLNSDGAFQADLNVERHIIVGGTVDGRNVAADGVILDTAITADANLTDDALVRGKGGALGAQTSIAILTDAGALSGLTKLTVDNLELDSARITVVGGTNLRLEPAAASAVHARVVGTQSADQDGVVLINTAWHVSSMVNTRTSLVFQQAYNSGGDLDDSGRITIGTQTNWTGTASTRDAYMAFFTSEDGVLKERMRIIGSGPVGINTTGPSGIHGSAMLDIRKDALCALAIYSFVAAATNDSRVFGARARGTNLSPAAVQDDDRLFTFQALGYDGSTYKTGAYIAFAVDGAVSAGVVPGEIVFATTASTAPVVRLIIQGDGDILVDSGTSVFVRDSALGFNSSVDGQLDLFADVECEITAPLIDLNAASIFAATMISGTDQTDAGAAAGELYVDTNADNTVKRGV